ncbi:MAG: SigB/SigF/SigG family RNA polymerase sigma factor [Anaerovoracaceae bacterium]|jgi:RNA polymerase sigma-B factor
MAKSDSDDKELFENYIKTKDLNIRNKIVEKYMYLVDILVKRYLNKGIDYDDLYQVGSMALILAADRYNPERGVNFAAFATPTILGEIKRYFRDKGWSMKVPRRLKDLSVKLPKVQQELEKELQRSPKISEIAERLGVSDETVIEAMESGRAYNAYSLQQSLEEDGSDSGAGSFLERYTGEEDRNFNTVENADILKRTMASFTPEEKKFCNMRFIEGMTQQQIAENLGVSQMTVSRIEKKIKARFKEEFLK